MDAPDSSSGENPIEGLHLREPMRLVKLVWKRSQNHVRDWKKLEPLRVMDLKTQEDLEEPF